MKKDDCTQHADKGSCVGLVSSALPEANNKILADSSDTGGVHPLYACENRIYHEKF